MPLVKRQIDFGNVLHVRHAARHIYQAMQRLLYFSLGPFGC